MASYKIAIIVGSLRRDSINRKVARDRCARWRTIGSIAT